MSSTQEQIAVMQAFVDGKEIQVKPIGVSTWQITRVPMWNWAECEYRIKPPEPKKVKLEAWLDGTDELRYVKPDSVTNSHWKRVPSEDKEILL